jgi:hypothetical protein
MKNNTHNKNIIKSIRGKNKNEMGTSSSVLTNKKCRSFFSSQKGAALIVSAYYRIPSKNTHEFYMQHIRRFLCTVQGPLVFFTSKELVDDLVALRPLALRALTRFVVLDVVQWDAWMHGSKFWDRQVARDVEKYHTPQLAAVWFMKHKFVLRAARAMNLDDNVPIVWCDAGALRNDAWNTHATTLSSRAGFHLAAKKNTDANTNADAVWVGELQTLATSTTTFRVFPCVHLAGAVLGGTVRAWKRFEAAYARTLTKYDSAGVSASSDQYVMSTMALQEPGIVNLVSVNSSAIQSPDPWFALLCVLASAPPAPPALLTPASTASLLPAATLCVCACL